MDITTTLLLFVIIFTDSLAKIHGGPRGRFDKQPPQRIAAHHVTAHHTHFSYHPPSHINFLCRYCTTMTTYPVYHGLPPTYVYKYRESHTRFGALLTGLALYNLGRSTEYWNFRTQHYTVREGDNCSLQVIDRSHFEEATFPCFMLSSFLDKPELKSTGNTLDITTTQINIKPYLQKTPVGSPIVVRREQECVAWHNTTTDKQRYEIPCALLKQYAETMKPAGLPVYVWLPTTIAIVVAIAVCCQNCYSRKKEFKDDAPHHQATVEGYLLNCNN
ncbi:hypothetical protein O0L34_g7307 [Tuta absoluta]|nr:hypothetical protein O0L34_g7307 [Tuta absoluta]